MKETIQEERMHYSREFKRSVIKEYPVCRKPQYSCLGSIGASF
jgi:hypothetical protein